MRDKYAVWILIVLIGIVIIQNILGISTPSPSRTSEGEVIVPQQGMQRCYNGVVYVQFGGGTSSWGGVMYGKDLKPVTC